MAHLLRRPLLGTSIYKPLSSRSPLPSQWQRCFSQSPPLQGARETEKQPTFANPIGMSREKSARVLHSQGHGSIPNDMGLMLATYIHPPFSSLPSKNPRFLTSLYYHRAKFCLRDFLSRVVTKHSAPRKGVGRYLWQIGTSVVQQPRKEIVPSALRLYSEMYKAFAAGDIKKLRKICADGIYVSMASRIGARRGEKVEWELVKVKRTKLESHRCQRFPPPMVGAALRQAVVRIESVQRLTRRDRKGGVIGGSGKEKFVVEHFVIQRRMTGWVEEKWEVWGMTDVTNVERDFPAWREMEGM